MRLTIALRLLIFVGMVFFAIPILISMQLFAQITAKCDDKCREARYYQSESL